MNWEYWFLGAYYFAQHDYGLGILARYELARNGRQREKPVRIFHKYLPRKSTSGKASRHPLSRLRLSQ